MKYLALLSGGKDSCYNLLHCAKNGHELIAAASLAPESGKEELDSYLYQTVGQDAIEFVARALEVPLYRRVITGGALEQGSEYGSRDPTHLGGVEGDETEDLYALLAEVKAHHPKIEGVSVGAILSDYQRVRVENVCQRLSLTPLCYLWQRDQGELLTEMIDAGMEAIIIKVAGIGLTIEHLGKSLAQMRPTLVELNSLYGSHICGEGGEYESLTLDCPLFKHRIVLTEVETVIHADNDFATVAFLRIKNAKLEFKVVDSDFYIYMPQRIEDDFLQISDAVQVSERLEAKKVPMTPFSFDFSVDPMYPVTSKKLDPWVFVSNVQAETDKGISVEEEVVQCFSILKANLASHDLQLTDCVNINIFLSSIELFGRVNAVYSKFFGASPPARACVAVDLPRSCRVRLDCVALNEHAPMDRQALHVQALSYWAPANIGPYSQAIRAKERIFISGQIGLIPGQLSLPLPPSLATETALSCQHVRRVVDALRNKSGGGWVGYTQLEIYWLQDIHNLPSIKNGHSASKAANFPTLFIVVKALPKGAMVEKQVLLHTGRCEVVDEDDGEMSIQDRPPVYERDHFVLSNGGALSLEVSHLNGANSMCAIVYGRGEPNHLTLQAQETLNLSLDLTHALSLRLFYLPTQGVALRSISEALFGEQDLPPTTHIPCRCISSIEKQDWDFAFCFLGI